MARKNDECHEVGHAGPIASTSGAMGNESTQAESLVKIETSLNLNDTELFHVSDDSVRHEEHRDLISLPFDASDASSKGRQCHEVGRAGPIASTSGVMDNESTQAESLVKASFNWNNTEFFDMSDDLVRNEEHHGLIPLSFDASDASSNVDNENSSVAALANVDPIQSAIDFLIDIEYPASPAQSSSDMPSQLRIKVEEGMQFLNLPDEILEISGEEFDALREDLAYDTDSEDSFVGLQKEFENLVSSGINLPAPIKEEPNGGIEKGVNVSNHVENRNNNLANAFDNEGGELCANNRIHTEYPNSQVDNNFDPVLGNMAKLVNVSERSTSSLNKCSNKILF